MKVVCLPIRNMRETLGDESVIRQLFPSQFGLPNSGTTAANILSNWEALTSLPFFDVLEWCSRNTSGRWSQHITSTRNDAAYRNDFFLIIRFECDKDYFQFKLKYGDEVNDVTDPERISHLTFHFHEYEA